MTQEILPTLQWVGIMLLAGFFYQPVSGVVMQNTNGAFSRLTANLIAYVAIGFGINLFFMWLKQTIGEKLTGSDLFGRNEYYLGMLAGPVRYACMVIVLIALMHARVYSAAELAETEKMQKKSFEDIRFPTYGSVQHAVLAESFTGKLIQDNLSRILIVSASPPKPTETIAQKNQETINAILGAPPKK
jgi:hypothetical protein